MTRPLELLGAGVGLVACLWLLRCLVIGYLRGPSGEQPDASPPAVEEPRAERARARAQLGGCIVVALVLALGAVRFTPLAVSLETAIREGTRSPGRYPYRNTFNVRDLRISYNEYLRVPGFEDEKQAIALFLLSQGVPPDELRPRR